MNGAGAAPTSSRSGRARAVPAALRPVASGAWPRRCSEGRRSSSRSTRSPTAGTAGAGRAARRLRRVRAARAAGRHGARARDEGAAPPRRGRGDRGRRRRARSGSRRRASTSRRAAAAASRISPTRRRSRPRQAWVDGLAAPDRRDRRAAGRADRPGRGRLPLPQQDGVLVRARARTAPELGLHRAGRWDEVLGIEHCWLTTDLGNAIRNTMRDWAREERLEAYDQADGTGYLRHLVDPRGREHGRGARPARDARAGALRPRAADRGADRSSRRCGRSTGRSTTRRPR